MNIARVQVSAALRFPEDAAIVGAAYDADRQTVVLLVCHEELPDVDLDGGQWPPWVWPSYAVRRPLPAAAAEAIRLYRDGVLFIGWGIEGEAA